MKIDFAQVLVDMDGETLQEPIPNKFEEDGKTPILRDVTLGRLCSRALLQPGEDEKIQGDEHLRRFLLAEKVHVKKIVEIEKVESVVLIKECLAQAFPLNPIVVGQSFKMIEGMNGVADAANPE